MKSGQAEQSGTPSANIFFLFFVSAKNVQKCVTLKPLMCKFLYKCETLLQVGYVKTNDTYSNVEIEI